MESSRRVVRVVSGVNDGLMSSVPSFTVPEAVVASLYCSLGYRAVIKPGRLHKGNVMFTAIPTHTQHNESHSLPTLATAVCQERRQTLNGSVCVRVHTHTHTLAQKPQPEQHQVRTGTMLWSLLMTKHTRIAHNGKPWSCNTVSNVPWVSQGWAVQHHPQSWL